MQIKIRILLIAISILLSLVSVTGQTAKKSRLLIGKIESVDKQIMFATLGIMEANIGTISDENGYFELEIPGKLINKKLTVSHIGYKTLHLDLDSLLNLDSIIITLTRKVEYINEVNVTSNKLRGKTKDYGNKKQHDLFLWIKDGDRGSEIATLISPKKKIQLNSVSINISNDEEKEFILLLNLYTVNKETQLPGKQILKKQRIIKSKQKQGWLVVDLKKEQIILNESFFASFQWVNIKQQVPQVGSQLSKQNKSFIRYKALGTWKRFADWDIKVNGTHYKNME